MTVKEAIERLKYDREMCYFNPDTGETGEPYDEECREMAQALDIAIEALNQEPNNDLINRKVATEYLKFKLENTIFLKTVKDEIESWIDKIPKAQPKLKTAQWLINSDGYYPYCSECMKEPPNCMTAFCPNCGAKMSKA